MDGLVKSVEELAGGTVVTVVGDVTLEDSPKFHTRLLEIVERDPARLIVDMAQVNHIDSAGVGTLVEVFRRVKSSGNQMFLVGLTPRVRSVFEITKLDEFFPIVDSRDEALDQ